MNAKVLLALGLVAVALLALTVVQIALGLAGLQVPGLGIFRFYWAWWFTDLVAYVLAIATLIGAGLGFERAMRGRVPRSLEHLRAGMISTAVAVIAATVLVFTVVASILGYAATMWLGLVALLFVAVPSLVTWLVAPAIINAAYRCRPDPELQSIVNALAAKAGMKAPKAMVSELPIPNAFAYSSPLLGRYIAVTRGLLKVVKSRGELEAVIGHELGHHKHRDNLLIMVLGLFPSLVYFLGRLMMMAGFAGAVYRDGGSREREGGTPLLVIVGIVLVAVSIVIQLAVLAFSRLREYYADAHGAKVTSPDEMAGALESLDSFYRSYRGTRAWLESSKIRALFIYALAEPFISLEEALATHPPIHKRIRFLRALKREGVIVA